jgi:hypothetical protein
VASALGITQGRDGGKGQDVWEVHRVRWQILESLCGLGVLCVRHDA